MQSSNTNNDIYRRSALIAGRTRKMALPYIGSTICVAAVTAIDSMIAGINIGSEALAAIAATGPLLAVSQILHCLLGYGTDKLMINAIGKGNRKGADRIFGTIIIAVFAVYLAVYLPMIIFERQLLQLFMKDTALIDMVIRYSRPLLITEPVFEVFLCIERAFRIDGRSKLLALRSINTNIGNILFDFLLVAVLKLDVSGLAWASVISTLIGYSTSLSHFFSRKRTVSPDFTVIFSFREMVSYIKEDIRVGSAAALDELLEGAALSVQTGAIGAVGGTNGLAVWAVYKSLRGIVISLSNGVSQSISVHAGLLYARKDYDGVRFAAQGGTKLSLAISLVVGAVTLAFAGPIAGAFNIASELRMLCAQCLRIGCIAFPAIVFLASITAYLPAVNRIGLSNLIVMIRKGLPIVAGIIGYRLGLGGVFVSYDVACWAAALTVLVLMKRDGWWFVPKRSLEMMGGYSVDLIPERISAVSRDVEKLLADSAYPADFSSRVALVVEDSMVYIARQNPEERIKADIEMTGHEGGIQITIIDDGTAYNPLSVPDKADSTEPEALEAMIVLGFAAETNYDRVLDLNHLTVSIRKSYRKPSPFAGKQHYNWQKYSIYPRNVM